jgi:FtsH-binding integral membrane protein
MEPTEDFVRSAGLASVAGGVLGLASLATVLGGEISMGTDFSGSRLAVAAGWSSFAAASLMVIGLLGLALRRVGDLTGTGRTALFGLTLATATTVGGSATLALVVPTLADRAPDLITDPPAGIPATFILSGLVMGVCGLVLTRQLRRDGLVSRGMGWLLGIASVVAIVPLPSRFFLLAFAIGAVVLAPAAAGAARTGTAAGRRAATLSDGVAGGGVAPDGAAARS